MRKPTLEQREGIPKSSWDLPQFEKYVRLGCTGCSNSVCFTAKGAEFMVTSDEDKDLSDLVREVCRREEVQQGASAYIYPDTEQCPGVGGTCPEAENIDLVVELLNDRFGASLQVPAIES